MLLCVTEYMPSCGIRRPDREIITQQINATRATPALLSHLHATADDEYRTKVTYWWMYQRNTVLKIQNGSTFDYWIWCT